MEVKISFDPTDFEEVEEALTIVMDIHKGFQDDGDPVIDEAHIERAKARIEELIEEQAEVRKQVSNPTEFNITPKALELAADNDISLADVTGTGHKGKITVGDVRAAIDLAVDVPQVPDYDRDEALVTNYDRDEVVEFEPEPEDEVLVSAPDLGSDNPASEPPPPPIPARIEEGAGKEATLRAMMRDYKGCYSLEEANKILAHYGANSVSSLEPHNRDALLEWLIDLAQNDERFRTYRTQEAA